MQNEVIGFVLLVHVEQHDEKGRHMKKIQKKNNKPEMLDEYDFSSGVRGKYAKRYQKGSNVIVLDPDVAKVFSDRESVNETLRALAKIIHRQEKKA